MVTVTPFAELRAVLRPKVSRGRRPGQHQVSVTNGGNTPVDTRVVFRDQDGELTFEPPGGAATLLPGATLDFSVRVNGPRRWFGRTEDLPFSAVVTSGGPQPPITLNGTRRQSAIFPWWTPAAVAIDLVALAISLFLLIKPDRPQVPAVSGYPETIAVQMLEKAHYKPDVTREADDNTPAGKAIKTDPAAGMQFSSDSRVVLFISTGKREGSRTATVEVPSVEGLSVNEAQSKLKDKKFTVRFIQEFSDERPFDHVITSNPEAGTLSPEGSEVTLTVSLGRHSSPLRTTSTPTLGPEARSCAPSSASQPPTGLTITSPRAEQWLKGHNQGDGTALLAPDEHLWLFICSPDVKLFYFTSEGHSETPVSNDTWKDQINLDPREGGNYFLYAVVVNAEDNRTLDQSRIAGGQSPSVPQLPQSAHYSRVAVRCCR